MTLPCRLRQGRQRQAYHSEAADLRKITARKVFGIPARIAFESRHGTPEIDINDGWPHHALYPLPAGEESANKSILSKF